MNRRVTQAVQIVPQLPPSVDGLGDYGYYLAAALRREFGVRVGFVVGDPSWSGPVELDGFPVERVSERTSGGMTKALRGFSERHGFDSGFPIFVNFVGYGYARRGCPYWLTQGLREWKNREATRLVTMFHETYAFGPPWRSSFWLCWSQRSVARALLSLSDAALTSAIRYQKTLESWGGTRVRLAPVFSNVGELRELRPLHERGRRAVMFGIHRSRIYRDCLPLVLESCRRLGLRELVDIGPATGLARPGDSEVSVRELGPLPAEEIHRILSDSRAGFVHYATKRLAKSGVFEAYCAHGMIPIACSDEGEGDALRAGVHYWVAAADKPAPGEKEAERIAGSAFDWYQDHAQSRHAAWAMEAFGGTAAA